MWLIWLLLIGVVIYFLFQRTQKSHLTENGSAEAPMDILRRRYAAGEITKEELEAKKKAIESQ